MKKSLLQQLKKKLEEERGSLEKELLSIAKKDRKLKWDWDSEFPRVNGGIGSQKLEEAADAVEEYATRLPIEFGLELKLREVNLALGKIKRERYGICEKCKKPIPQSRLKACPEARFCLKCRQRK